MLMSQAYLCGPSAFTDATIDLLQQVLPHKNIYLILCDCNTHLIMERAQREKWDYVGKIPNLGGGQTHFLMSTYQVIFGMPK